jgi:hypothetical protein
MKLRLWFYTLRRTFKGAYLPKIIYAVFMALVSRVSKRTLLTFLAVASAVVLALLSGQAFAAPSMSSGLSVSTVSAGNKVDLTTQIPGVNEPGLATQEIIQN